MTSLSDTVDALLKSAKIGASELRAGVAWQVQGGGAKLDMTARNDRRRAIQRNTCYIRQKLEAASPAESVDVLAEVAKLEKSIAPFEHRADVIRTAGSIAKLLSFVTMVIQLVLGISWIVVGGIGVVLVAPLCTILAPPLTLIGVGRDSLPMALVLSHWALITLALAGIVINVETTPGVEALRGKPALCMFSHGSNLDAFILFASSPLACIGVGKRSTFFMPIIGWIGLAAGFVSVNRTKREKAMEALGEAAAKAAKNNSVIMISPEGTRSTSGLLAEFKKGPFYMRENMGEKTGVLSATILGAYELWPPRNFFTFSGYVTVRYQALTVETLSQGEATMGKESRARIGAELRTRWLSELAVPAPVPSGGALGVGGVVYCILWGGLGLLLELGLFRGVQTAVAVFGLTMLHVAGLVGLLCLAVNGYVMLCK